MLYETIGTNIKRLRNERNMTQAELADILHVSHQMISKFENGTAYPEIEMLVRIALVFSVSIDSLCGFDMTSRDTAIAFLNEKYGNICGTYREMAAKYDEFMIEAEDLLNDDRVMKLQLSILEQMHDNIENGIQHVGVNEKIFRCATRILDISRDDELRSFANYRMAIYYHEQPFNSLDRARDLELAKEHMSHVLLATFFPDYTPIVGTDLITDEYRTILESNIEVLIQQLLKSFENLQHTNDGSIDAKYNELFELLKNLI